MRRLIPAAAILLAAVSAAGAAGPGDLHAAVRRGDAAEVKRLLVAGADARAKDARGATAMRLAARGDSRAVMEAILLHVPDVDLLAAIEKGDADGLALRLAYNPDLVAYRSERHDRPMPTAIKHNRPEVVEVLLSAGASADGEGESYWPPLVRAAREGNLQIARILLAHKAKINTVGEDDDNETPLNQAAASGNLELVELLLASGAKVNFAHKKDNYTALHAAAWNKHAGIVRRLLAAGADVNAETKWGFTPLHSALWAGDTITADILLKHGAKLDLATAAALGRVEDAKRLLARPLSPKLANSIGPAALLWAVRRGQVATASVLLDAGRDINDQTGWGLGPLHRAVAGGHAEMVRLLLDRGAKVNATNEYDYTKGCTPLVVAAAEGHEQIAQVLLDRGADVGAANKDGETPLHVAAGKGHTALAVMLLDRGAELKAISRRGETPMEAAARGGHLKTVRELLARGADPNGELVPGPGWVASGALHGAARSGHVEVVRLLLDKGANISAAPDRSQTTALLVAAEAGHLEVVRLLVRRGADIHRATKYSGTALGKALYGARHHHEKGDRHLQLARWLLRQGAKPGDGPAALRPAAGLGDVELLKVLAERTPQGLFAKRGGLLHAAAKAGRKDMVRFLLAKGLDPAAKDGSRKTALEVAAAAGQKLIVKILLDRLGQAGAAQVLGAMKAAASAGHAEVVALLLGRSGTAADAAGCSAVLAAAAGNGRRRVVEVLLAGGVDVNEPGGQGAAIHAAVGAADIQMVRMLISRGADVDAVSKYKQPLLYVAATHRERSRELVELLLGEGADPNVIHPGTQLTSLDHAIQQQRWDVAELLVKHKARVDVFAAAALGRLEQVRKVARDTPSLLSASKGRLGALLAWAALGGRTEVVKFLCAHELVNVNDVVGKDATALYWAARGGHVEAARILLANGAQVNGGVAATTTPLHLAVRYRHVAMVRLLLGAGANASARGISKWTPLHVAANAGDAEIARMLLKGGADVNAAASDKKTALSIVMGGTSYGTYYHHDPEHSDTAQRYLVAEALLDHKADVKAGASVTLHWAASGGHVKLLRRLIAAGLDVNATNRYKLTPLHSALTGYREARVGREFNDDEKATPWHPTENPHMQTVRLLLEKGADVHARDKHGRDALSFATYDGTKELIELIRKHAPTK